MHFNNDLLEILFCTTMNPEKISLSSGTCANVIQTYLGITITAEDEENALGHYPK